MARIWTITMNPAIDKSSAVENVVAERKLRCASPRFEPGGGGINVSRAIAKLGGESLAFYLAGGGVGQMMDNLLQSEGILYESVPVQGMTRENLIIYEGSTGQQYRFGMPGPEIHQGECEGLLERLERFEPKPEFVAASGSLPPGVPVDFYARVSRAVRKFGGKLIVDASGEALARAVEASVFLIKPNIREMQSLAGKSLGSEGEQEEYAAEIVKQGGSEIVVISLGAAGALATWKDGWERVRAPTVPIRSKVGAGDSTVAGIVLALSRGLSIPDAIRFGVAAGAAAVMTPGTELCRREDTEDLYKKISTEQRSAV
ncbi:MAG: 1-phosphofructokinase family hexose kinase [Desulfobacterales bacterium]|nr:1-phosphofructokinase family hexose kinase [Desulfobacterales bacterium]